MHRAKRERDRHTNAFNLVQSGVGDLQEPVAKCESELHDNLFVEFL